MRDFEIPRNAELAVRHRLAYGTEDNLKKKIDDQYKSMHNRADALMLSVLLNDLQSAQENHSFGVGEEPIPDLTKALEPHRSVSNLVAKAIETGNGVHGGILTQFWANMFQVFDYAEMWAVILAYLKAGKHVGFVDYRPSQNEPFKLFPIRERAKYDESCDGAYLCCYNPEQVSPFLYFSYNDGIISAVRTDTSKVYPISEVNYLYCACVPTESAGFITPDCQGFNWSLDARTQMKVVIPSRFTKKESDYAIEVHRTNIKSLTALIGKEMNELKATFKTIQAIIPTDSTPSLTLVDDQDIHEDGLTYVPDGLEIDKSFDWAAYLAQVGSDAATGAMESYNKDAPWYVTVAGALLNASSAILSPEKYSHTGYKFITKKPMVVDKLGCSNVIFYPYDVTFENTTIGEGNNGIRFGR